MLSSSMLEGTLLDILLALRGVGVSKNAADGGGEREGDLIPSAFSLLVTARYNSWSRSARRAEARLASSCNTTHAENAPTEQDALHSSSTRILNLGLVLNITILPGTFIEPGGGGESQRWVLVGHWLRGRDRSLFESLWGHLYREVVKAAALKLENDKRTVGKRDRGTLLEEAGGDGQGQGQGQEVDGAKRARRDALGGSQRVLDGTGP